MITREEATLLATRYVECLGRAALRLALLPESTAEYPFGWVFFYTSQEFLRTGDPTQAVGGNAPLLVERATGHVWVTGTAYPTQHYLDRYLETGDPHGELSSCILFQAATSRPDKLATVQAIRDLAGLPATVAKSLVDRSLDGESVTLEAPDANVAGELIARLEALGWNAKRHYGRKAEPATGAG
jgi:hypothetical protein